MTSTLSSEFTQILLTSYKEYQDNNPLVNPNLDSIVCAIQFFNMHDYFLLPSGIYFLESGDLTIQWSSPENLSEHSRMCQVVFSRNKTILFSTFDFNAESHTEILNYESSFEYGKKVRELGIKILNYLEGDIGIKAFNNL